jgi:lipoprotein-releasing system ATP-binding protein
MEVRSLYREPEASPREMEWPALELHDVFKIYRSGPVETVALRGLDLEVRKGEIIALLGPSGCGKSTLLALAAGLDRPSAGEVRAFGDSLEAMGEQELARYRARRIGIVFQSDNLLAPLSARENVQLTLGLAGFPEAAARAADALRSVGLGARMANRVTALSGGEQQRVAIARAVANAPRALLADEPTGNLDPHTSDHVFQALMQLVKATGVAMLIATHNMELAGRMDRRVSLVEGRVVELD